MRKTVLERLAEQSTRVGECLLWNGPQDKEDYGVIWAFGGPMRVHRAAWMARNGLTALSADKHVLHHCDTPNCWSETCLFLGNHADNMADRKAKGRYVRPERCKRDHLLPLSGPCRPCRTEATRRYRARQKAA